MKRLFVASLALGAAMLVAGNAQAQVKFAVAGPMTGPNAAFGAQLKNGAEQAIADLNAKGGIMGQKIASQLGDDVSDPKQGVSVANKFVSDGVKFVVGHFNSGVSIPASEVYAEAGIFQVTPASTNPRFTDRNLWNTHRTCGRDDQQGAVAAAHLLKNFKGKKVAIVHDKTPYGKGLADETQKGINAGGLKEVMYEGINTGEKDFSALVSKMKAAAVDAVYFGGLHTEAGLIIRQMREQGMKTVLISGDGLVSNEFWSIAGPGAEGTLMTFNPDPRKNPAAKDVVAAFKAKNIDPEAYTLYAYAAVQVIAQAAEAAKSLDPKKVAETVRSGRTFKTVIGDLSYDKKGDLKKADYIFYVWKNGTYVEM